MPLTLVRERPTNQEILERDDGERLLAGYLLSRTTDRVVCRGQHGHAVLAMDFEH